ncbi:MAG: CopD family protein [Silvibacterium sp.]
MIWLLQDLDLLSVVLRALSFSFEALAVGGALFLWLVATPRIAEPSLRAAVARFVSWFALALAIIQALAAAESSASLMSSGLGLPDVASAVFFRADCVVIAAALALFFVLRLSGRAAAWSLLPAAIVVSASVTLSHAASQLDHRAPLLALTAVHHLGAAAWIGAMPSLLVALRRTGDTKTAHAIAARFSALAIASVVLLVLAGIGLSYFYVASWQGLYGTSYGIMLLAKIYLLLVTVALGASNYFLVKGTRDQSAPILVRLRRFSEAEIGLGFTAIVIAASMTSMSPARDIGSDQATRQEIAQRFRWERPTLHSPSFAQLPKRLPLTTERLESATFGAGSDNGAMDRAWSEYNHHWSGLIVLAAGLFAFVARFKGQQWARNWPLLFMALAVFILLRADPEAWPLGPHAFWASFVEPDILEHRLFALIISAFAIFEWAVETGRLTSGRAALVFPALCALGGALLLTHMHGFGDDAKNEMLVGLSHSSIAVLGATAGWARWLQIRLPGRKASRFAAWIWPICLVLVGILLLDYREA